jgi:hypothetical protein
MFVLVGTGALFVSLSSVQLLFTMAFVIWERLQAV